MLNESSPKNMNYFIKIKIVFLFIFLFAPAKYHLYSQSISGVINTYTNVTLVSGNVVTVGSSAGFSVGDKVLIIQMKGATINSTNTPTFGQITSYNDAGNYEYATIQAINGNQITLTTNLCNTYSIPDAVQLIRVPVYNNPVITATLTCQPWNGTIGGVLVFDVTGTLTFNANIDVRALGFRGGAIFSGGFNCATNVYAAAPHGKKGEGIVVTPVNFDGGRAPLANGGGGSLNGNCGAGGGSNYGTGGRGGNSYSGCGASTIWGEGGYALTMNSSKIFLGGGGGGGFRDNGQNCAPGANGGGIVMINAAIIDGNGFSIFAQGGNVATTTNDEGAGAGGGGGAVYLWSPTYSSNLNVNVSGGNGGNIQNTIFTTNAHGPGGGGGGGYVWISEPGLPPNLNVTSNGGAAGLILHAGIYFNTTYGAASGNSGAVLYNLPPLLPPLPPPFIGNDTTICAESNLLLDAGTGYSSYTWNDGSNGQTLTTSGPGIYWVEVPVGCGTNQRDSITVLNFNPQINIGNDVSFCDGDSALFDAGSGFLNYLWNDGSSSSSLWVYSQGQYYVTAQDTNGCITSDTANVIDVYPVSNPNLGNDTSICTGDMITLNAGLFNQYQWNTNEITPSIDVFTTGVYHVTVTDVNGCLSSDTIQLNIYPPISVDLGNDLIFCPGETAVLNPGNGFSSYLWQNGLTTSTQTVSTQGIYYVTVSDVNGCTASDTLTVVASTNFPEFTLGPDISICPGEQVQLVPTGLSVPVTYLWSDASQNNYLTVNDTGSYELTVTDVNGCSYSDEINVIIQCPPTLYIPNAFTPNLDSFNTNFMAYGTNIREFKMEIFNRWGELIYTINTLNDYWSGVINDEPAPLGIYAYKVSYKDFLDDELRILYGHVSIIR